MHVPPLKLSWPCPQDPLNMAARVSYGAHFRRDAGVGLWAMDSPTGGKLRHRVWHTVRAQATTGLVDTVRENFSTWLVVGLVVSATGAAPEEWFNRILHSVRISSDALHLWGAHVDLRVAIFFVGMAIIVGDVLWRQRGHRKVTAESGVPAAEAGPAAVQPATGPEPGDRGVAAAPENPPLRGDFADLRAVAVLPFDNLSKDPAEDYFVDGLTEDIITALAYWRWFPVVARNSTLAYKGKPKNVTEIGRELGAAYLVEGSARRSGDQVRITVQLIETATGHHLFAERYDRGMADVFIVQDEIAERIVASIEPEIHRAEARRAERKHPSDLGAWDHALRALFLQERMTPARHAEARDHLKLALEIDPTSARAWSLLSLCHYHEGILGWAKDRGNALQSSLAAAEQAIRCDDREWLAQGLWGMGRLWTERDFSSALEGAEHAVALNPSAPLARHFLGCVLEFSGRPMEALPHLDAILRLDPRYRFRSLAIADQSLCHLLLGNLDEAISTAEKAVRTQPGNVRARQRLVAALSLRGLDDRARAAAIELSRLQPALDIAYIDDTYPFMLSDERDRFVGALRAAGLLEK